jgi:predicted esterase YcpF (UPF0227 family)
MPHKTTETQISYDKPLHIIQSRDNYFTHNHLPKTHFIEIYNLSSNEWTKKTYKLNCNLLISLNISTCNKKRKKNEIYLWRKNDEHKKKKKKKKQRKNLSRSLQRSRYRSSYQDETYSQHEVPFKEGKINKIWEPWVELLTRVITIHNP